MLGQIRVHWCKGPVILPGSVFVVMTRDQNAERSHNIKTDNRSFERVEKFKCLGIMLTNQNFIQDEIEVRKCFLSFGAESYVFQFFIQKFKD